MRTRFIQTFLFLGFLLLVIDWVLGVARFRSDLAQYVFVILNLPSSLVFAWLDNQQAAWWREFVRLKPEIGSAMAFLAMIGVQAGLLSLALTKRQTP